MPQNPVTPPRFLAALDTVGYHESESSRVAAELQLSLLFGQKVLLSQTQALDCGHFLKMAQGDHEASFLKLIQRGSIRIHLQKSKDESSAPSLRKLLVAKVQDPTFHLSGWPEIPAIDEFTPPERKEQRKEQARVLDEAMAGTTDSLKGLKSLGRLDLEARWDVLRRLDNARKQALDRGHAPEAHMSAATPSGRDLDERIVELTQGMAAHSRIRAVLRQTALTQTRGRSHYFRAINASIDLSPKERWDAHEYVNAEYNCVIARSLQAFPNLIASSAKVGDLLQERSDDPDAIQRPIAAAPEYDEQLEGLTWDRLAALLDHLQPTQDESLEERADRARYLGADISIAAKEIYDAQGKRGIQFVLKEGAVKAVSSAAPALAAVGAAVATHATLPAAWSFLLSPVFLAACWPTASFLIQAATGHKVSLDAFVGGRLAKRGVEGKTHEIINIIKRNPHYPHSVEA